MPFIPHTKDEVEAMLDAIGASKIDDLFDEIPPELFDEPPPPPDDGGMNWYTYGPRIAVAGRPTAPTVSMFL